MTGETVAVKQIQLANIPKSELGEIMSEIDLLKNLNHPNIVKYKGSEKTRDYLYIILEYCENGSLHNICKRFGKFPEGLVGVYISQVLDGLLYLHDQGVIHRDIKGANILTTKDGSVKLADFGVATKTGALSDYAVVGSPYWMAPEVIDQSGATTASDIWSVGCVVVELLEGKPPYHFLAPMPALFRIVQDDCPPLPEGASPVVKDFLLHCFQKDSNLRVSAKKLLRHPWMMAARKQLEQMKTGGSIRGSGISGTVYDEAVKSVQEWNQALKEPPKPAPSRINDAATLRAPAQPSLRRVTGTISQEAGGTARPAIGKGRKPNRPTLPVDFSPPIMEAISEQPDESVYTPDTSAKVEARSSAEAGSAPAPQTAKLPIGGAAPATSLMDQRSKLVDLQQPEEETDNWDDDFEEDITTTKIAALKEVAHPVENDRFSRDPSPEKVVGIKLVGKTASQEPEVKRVESDDHFNRQTMVDSTDYDQRTIRPPTLRNVSSSPQFSRGIPPTRLPNPERDEQDDDDYSDLVQDGDESHLNERIRNLKLQNSIGKRLFHPDDLRRPPVSNGSPLTPPPQPSTPTEPLTPHSYRPQSPAIGRVSPAASRANSMRMEKDEKWKEMRRALGRYSEDDSEEDYSDVFGDSMDGSDGDQLIPPGQRLQLTTRLSNRSWLGDDIEDEDDPFAEIDEGLDAEADLEANVARDQHARMCAFVTDLVEALKPEQSEKELRHVCEQIDQVLTDMPEMKTQLLSSHGALALIQLLEISSDRVLVTQLLGILNLIIFEDAEAQENLCLIGAIPVVMTFTTKKWPHDLRLEAAHFIFAMCSTSRLTLQFVLSCRGLRTLVDLIDEDYDDQRDLVWIGVGCISSVLELQSPASRNDFCRMLAQEGLLEPLSSALTSVIGDGSDPYAQEALSHILQAFLIFSQSDTWLKKQVAARGVLRRILQTASALDPEPLTQMLKIIKNLSMSPTILDEMQNANTIEILTNILAKHHTGPHGAEMANQVLNTMYNLCRLSKSRQEEAAQAGIIPQLMRVARNNSPLKQFALPILCDLAHAGKTTRKMFWQHQGLEFYLKLLEDPYWQVSALESILVWLQDETHRVEEVLLHPSSIDSLLCLFTTAKANAFENLLEPYLKICRLSNGITIAMGKNPAFLRKLIERLNHPKALVRLNLLRITKMVCDVHPERSALIQQFSLFEIIDKLSKQDGAVLVRELARDVLSQRYMQTGRRTVRRTLSENSVGLPPSAPPKDSHGAVPSSSSVAVGMRSGGQPNQPMPARKVSGSNGWTLVTQDDSEQQHVAASPGRMRQQRPGVIRGLVDKISQHQTRRTASPTDSATGAPDSAGPGPGRVPVVSAPAPMHAATRQATVQDADLDRTMRAPSGGRFLSNLSQQHTRNYYQ